MKTQKVLIVDDEPETIHPLQLALEDEGYKVITAEDGKTGMKMARSTGPDIILLDVMLPETNGIEICRSLKADADYKSIPIIMLTGLTRIDDTVKGLSSGADDYVSKPYILTELLARVKSNLKMKELYDAVKNADREKSIFLDISQTLSQSLDPNETLFVIVSKIAEFVRVKRCSILSIDPSNRKVFVMASHDSKDVNNLELDLNKYPEIQKVIATGESVIIKDAPNDPLHLPVKDILTQVDIKSIMVFPIIFKDTLIGTLILRTSRRGTPFSDSEARFCSVISHLAASPLRTAYLFSVLHKEKDMERQAREDAEAKNKASRDLLEVICRSQSQFILDADPRVSFDGLLTNLLTLTCSEYGFISEVLQTSEGAPYLKAHAISCISWNEQTKIFFDENVPKGLEFKNLQTLFGAVITSGRPVIANDPSRDSRKAGLPEGHPPLKAFLGLPFFRGEKILGVVGIANRNGGYDQALVDYLQPFLSTCSSIMESFRNETRRKEAEERLKSAYAELKKKSEDLDKRQKELDVSLKEKEVLLREIHHRVKNNMQIITSLLGLHSMHTNEIKLKEILKESENRVKSMSLIHERLYRAKDLANINFQEYIEYLTYDIFHSFGIDPGNVALTVEAKNINLGVDVAVSCGLLLNELISNSLKYAFPADRKGALKITMRRISGPGPRNADLKSEIELIVSDNGIGLPKDMDFKSTNSLGLVLVNTLVGQLHGEIELDRKAGTKFEVRFRSH